MMYNPAARAEQLGIAVIYRELSQSDVLVLHDFDTIAIRPDLDAEDERFLIAYGIAALDAGPGAADADIERQARVRLAA